jgi:hypothetical protein
MIKEVQIEQHIRVYENVLSKEYCESLIDKYEQTNASRKGEALFRDKVEEIEVPTFDLTDPDYNADAWNLWQNVDDQISEFSDMILSEYFNHYMVEPYEYAYCGCKMLYYPPLSHSPLHYDDELVARDGGSIGVARPLTLVVFLNDNFEGGELVFPDQNVIIKPKQGAIAVFPASFMYPHTTVPTCGKQRYVLLPFYRKAGLNVKIEKYNKKCQEKKQVLNEYRSLYCPTNPISVEETPLLTKEEMQ